MICACFFKTLPSPKRCWVAVCLGLIAVALTSPTPAIAQSTEELKALTAEIDALKRGQAQIRADLAQIKRILLRRPSGAVQPAEPHFQPVTLDNSGSPFLGDLEAPVTLVEFTDYQCPYCRRHSISTKPRLVKDYVNTGKLKYVVREFPIGSIHPQAPKAAEATLCAGDQDKYWAMGTLLFQNQIQLQPTNLSEYAQSLDLDILKFDACMKAGKYAEQVQEDIKAGSAAGVRGTPSFLLGLTDPNDQTKIRATVFLRGARSYTAFKRAIDELIAEGS